MTFPVFTLMIDLHNIGFFIWHWPLLLEFNWTCTACNLYIFIHLWIGNHQAQPSLSRSWILSVLTLAAGDETIRTNERSLDDPVPPPPVVLLLVDLNLLAIRGQDRCRTNNPIPTLLWPLLSRLKASSLSNCFLFLGVLLDHTASLPVGECECDEGWACSRWRIGGRWSHLKVEKGRRRALGHSQITDQPDWSTSGFRLICATHYVVCLSNMINESHRIRSCQC